MANWLDPGSPAVRAVLTGVMLASLLMAAALPGAFGAANANGLAVAAILVLRARLGSQISALALSATVAALLSALALWELRTPARAALGTRLGTPTDAPRGLIGDIRHLQQQQEGTS
jgi:hypothetical protein